MRKHNITFTGRIVLYGGPGDDELTGGPGDDDLRGYGGGDNLDGAAGNDRLAGMAGVDDLYGGPGDDTGYGGPGDDYLTAGGGNDRFYGGPGDDRLYGGPGDDRLAGGPGPDEIYGDEGELYGEGGSDELYGGPGGDYIMGEGGDDRLYGGPGDDVLGGYDGDDLLSGGPGDDRLSGGGGADTFRFAPGHSIDGDVITDFDYAAGDRIMLTGFSTAATLTPAYDADGDFRRDDRQIILPDGGRVTLLNVGDAELSIEGITIDALPGAGAQAAVAPAVETDPDPAPDILADGETYFVDHWISRWSLRIDEAPAIGATYHLVVDEGVVSFGLGLTHAVTGQVIWTNGIGAHPDFSDETMQRQIESHLRGIVGPAGWGDPNSPLSIRVNDGGGTAADPYVLEFNKALDLQAREGSGIGFIWDGDPGGVSITEAAATHPAAFTLTFDGVKTELPNDVGKAYLDSLAEYVFYDGLSWITATEVDDGAWELELTTTAPITAEDFTAEGAVLELLA